MPLASSSSSSPTRETSTPRHDQHPHHHHHHHNHHSDEDVASLPVAAHTSSAFGDWTNEIDSAAPFIVDRLYGDNDNQHTNEADNQTDCDSDSDSDSEAGDTHLQWIQDKKWYRRPNEMWLRPFAFLLALASGMIMGPKVEMYYSLICEEMGISGVDALLSIMPSPQARQPVSTQCHKSQAAEAAQAHLQLRLTLALGILSVLTTGFWGGVSDRKGRLFVLRLAVFGLTINAVFFIIVGLFPISSLPFGKNFLIFGSAIEGCLGGFATLAAQHQAYIADVTPNGTRTNVYSMFTGILFLGFFLGPSLGSLMIKATNNLISPFYFAFASNLVYLLFTILVLPESVSKERQLRSREEHTKYNQEASDSARVQSWATNLRIILSAPFRPLALLLPHRRHDQEPHSDPANTPGVSHISVSRTQTEKLDWNLTILAIAYFIETMCYGVVTPKINYAVYMFNWGAQQIGYFISFSSMSRVICLALVIPLFIKWWRKPVKGIALPHDGMSSSGNSIDEGETRHLLDDEGRPAYLDVGYGSTTPSNPLSYRSSRLLEKRWTLRARHLRQIHDSSFDKRLAILSISINGICFLLLAISRNMGPIPFVTITGLTSLGGAASAAMSSLALALLETDGDAGKLFAAWSVISAISSTVLGPIAFIELFAKTVSWLPESIFVLASGEFQSFVTRYQC
jgi:MFS family permease